MKIKEYYPETNGILKCKLKYLDDYSMVGEILTLGQISDVLIAEIDLKQSLNYNEIMEFAKESIDDILKKLKKIEEENPLFYSHFEVDYNKYHIGPTLGSNKQYSKFWIKPKIEKIKVE